MLNPKIVSLQKRAAVLRPISKEHLRSSQNGLLSSSLRTTWSIAFAALDSSLLDDCVAIGAKVRGGVPID